MVDVGIMFIELGIVVILAAVAAYILKLFKQPQILSYVLVGVLIGPVYQFFTKTTIVDAGFIESMSIIGIAFLLFIVGMEMDIKGLRSVALVSTLGGLIQVMLIFLVGYLAALTLGFISLEAAYIGLILAFSSTMVVMKLLSDRKELNTLHGRIVVGILLLQDIVAILALSILSSASDFSLSLLGIAVLKFLLLFAVAYLVSKYILTHIFRYAAKKTELLLITSLAVCFLFSLAFYFLGFSVAIGAFIAGVALGNLPYDLQIISKVKSLKDFFSLLFFVSLGMGLSLGVVKEFWLALIVLLALVMFLKPAIIMLICSLFKYTKKPAFLSANALAQVGEFSLILAAQGLALNHISADLFSLVVIVTLTSITLTSYYIENNQWFYKKLSGPLKIFDRFTTEGLEYLPTEVKPKIILCGHNRLGYSILKNLENMKKKVLVVDYNPEIISRMVKNQFHCIYGEVTDEEIVDRMNLEHITMLISTVPNTTDSLYLIRSTREVNKRAKIIVTAAQIEEALKLYEAGADYVVLPHFLGGDHVAQMITKIRKKKVKIKDERKKHIEHLHERKAEGHEHPQHR
jgi:Kef-type K+ transport system membrane component KefB